ncbi:FMN-dependent NADH-azoreductase [Paenibacillus sinopodophylli]|uniref:FMN-dependent NADH-azoreductase n=1 Tax=Paenibacillus sinopodophylli TaxID=1837342 RepID=UPI00110CE6A6|nr:FMN-dependent NADH-azoreductase [Paenibacillus sinopodophylli]
MSNVLFVKANDRKIENSVSVKLYHAFLDSYKESHPEDNIIELDLYKEELPYMNADLIEGNFKVLHGIEVSPSEQAMVDRAAKYADQFVSADKVVFGFPLWNQTIPAVLHTYIDYIYQVGKTFRYTNTGTIGLTPDKKVAIVNARGGVYSEGPKAAHEMSVNLVRTVMGIFGITNIEYAIVDGHHQLRDQSEKLIINGIEHAKQVALKF